MTTHDAILILAHMNLHGVDFVKFPSGTIISRMDCEEALDKP